MSKKSVIEGTTPEVKATVNVTLLEGYKAIAMDTAEHATNNTVQFARDLLASGDSVRNMRATLEEGKIWVKEYNLTATVKVKALDIPTSKVEYLATAFKILDTVTGADTLSWNALLNMALQAQRKIGADKVADAITGSEDTDALVQAIRDNTKPTDSTKVRATRTKATPTVEQELTGLKVALEEKIKSGNLTIDHAYMDTLVAVMQDLAQVARANGLTKSRKAA